MKKDSLYLTERQHQANRLLRDGDYKSIRDMLGRIKDQLPKSPILAELDEKKEIKYWNSEDLYEEVMCLGDGLLDAGLGGKHIAIVSENCVRYVIADICISSGVGVVTPIDVNAPAPLLAMLLAKCDADAALCGAEQLPLLREVQPQCPRLKALITIDKKVDGVPYYEELVARGAEAVEDDGVLSVVGIAYCTPLRLEFQHLLRALVPVGEAAQAVEAGVEFVDFLAECRLGGEVLLLACLDALEVLLVALVDDSAGGLEALPDGFALVLGHGTYLLVFGVQCLQLLECRHDVLLSLCGECLCLLAEALFGLKVLAEVILACLDVELEQVVELLHVVLVCLPYLCGSLSRNGLYLFPCSL